MAHRMLGRPMVQDGRARCQGKRRRVVETIFLKFFFGERRGKSLLRTNTVLLRMSVAVLLSIRVRAPGREVATKPGRGARWLQRVAPKGWVRAAETLGTREWWRCIW